ncbi:MAG: ComF family protein [Planctomycetota bacterium]
MTVRVRHFGWHAESLRALILRAKWHQEWSLIRMLGRWLAEVARSENYAHGLDGWVAVPRDLRRRLLHGKPLAEHLAAEVGRRLQLPRIAAPRRARRAPQVALGAIARRRNLRGAFSLSARGRQRIRDRRLLLIDDVITTGSTIEECAHALLDAGAREVRALVLAVAPDPESDRGR